MLVLQQTLNKLHQDKLFFLLAFYIFVKMTKPGKIF
jgi:hypothetical protein